MIKFVILGVFLFAAEVASICTIGQWAGWPIMLSHVLLTGLLGICAICFMPTRWKTAMRTDPAWLWMDPVGAAKYLGTDPAHVEECLKADTRKGQLLLLAAVLLIIPGLISDVIGFLVLVWLIGSSLRQRRPSSPAF